MQCNFELLNKGDAKLIIQQIKGEYMNVEKKWTDFDETRRGERRGYYNYSWVQNSESSLTVEPQKPTNIAFCGGIYIRQKQFDKHRRVHKSLPIPLQIRFTLIAVNGGTLTINVSADNEDQPLSLDTQSSRLKKQSLSYNESLTPVGYVQCDDLELETRAVADIYLIDTPSDRYWRLYSSIVNTSSQTYIYESQLKKLAYSFDSAKAVDGRAEILLTDLCKENKELGLNCNFYQLLDVTNRFVYGLRVELTTNTSSVIKTFLLFPKTYKPPVRV